MGRNEFLAAWDAYIMDSDEMFTQEEYLAFKNGWISALDFMLDKGRSLWNDATFIERSQTR
jgi:hypothetical protein